MKNKLKQTMTALCAALILMGGFSVPAYAQGTAAEPPTEDATNDSNVVVEEPETPPLTPKGNATLVTISAAISSLSLLPPKAATTFISSLTGQPRGNRPYISLIKWTKPTLWH